MAAAGHPQTRARSKPWPAMLLGLGCAVLASWPANLSESAFRCGSFGADQAAGRRSALQLAVAAAAPVLLPAESKADVIRLVKEPLPKAFSESVTAAAKALKEALEAEEAVGDSFIGPEQEAKLASLEQKAGRLVQIYGETYISEDSLSSDAPLRKNQVHFEMEETINSFENAVKTDKLPKYRKELIERLQTVLDLAETSGVE